MQLPALAFTPLALDRLPATVDPGQTGRSLSRTYEANGLRLRIVEYEAGYLADHWCDRGHVFHLISGEATVELRDGRAFALRTGEGFAVSDHGDAAHRVRSGRGAVAFIVD